MNRLLFVGAVMASMLVSFAIVQESIAANGQPFTVRAGFVNLTEVKQTYPLSAVYDKLKADGEAALRWAVDQANDQIKKAQAEKKTDAEIEKLRSELQAQILARQESLSQLIMSQNAMATAAINTAVQTAAHEKDVDFVVDISGVIVGNKKLAEEGVDITDLVKKQLQPQTSTAAKQNTTK